MTMFARDDALDAFLAHLGAPLGELAPAEAVRLMLDFYAEVTAKGVVDDEHDGDMLLFQWGVPRRRPEVFLVNMTRQLIYPLDEAGSSEPDDDDDGWDDKDFDDEGETEIWQLRLDYEIAADEALTGLGRGDIWCRTRDDLMTFRDEVLATEAFRALEDRPVRASDVDFGAV